jgi:hypothetical protein
MLKPDTLSDLTIPTAIETEVQNQIGKRSISQLYHDFGITKTPSKKADEAHLPARAHLQNFSTVLSKELDRFARSDDPEIAAKAEALKGKLPEWETFVDDSYALFAAKAEASKSADDSSAE